MIGRRQFLASASMWAADPTVRFNPELEPLMRLLEDTPEEKCDDLLLAQMRGGTTYQQFLAALFLAGVRNINPNPCGFALHCVFVVSSAHQLAMSARPEERILPLAFAMHNLKESQQKDVKSKSGDFVLKPLAGPVPSREKAAVEFTAAMEAWDRDRAQRAVVGLIRTRKPAEVIEVFWRYGARDYRNIGHKAIFVANAWRTLQTIGWQHAEPVLRSVVIGILDYAREERVNGYAFEDQCYLGNAVRVRGYGRGDWSDGHGDTAGVARVLEMLRSMPAEQACNEVMRRRIPAGSVWSAIHLSAAEMMLRKPGSFIGVHAVTSMNALHYAGMTSTDPATRALLLLQGIGWTCQFQEWYRSREKDIAATSILDVTPESTTLNNALSAIGREPLRAMQGALALAKDHTSTHSLKSALRQLVFTKGNEAHYYKYTAALFEDFHLTHQDLSAPLLASAVSYMKAPDAPDVPWLSRVRSA